jgi:GAF domain-containing protein
VPLISNNIILGVINLESDVLNAFTKKEENIIVALAGQAAIAIETAFWLESTSLGLDRLEKLQNISNALSKYISEPKLLLDTIVRNICDLTGADCSAIYPYDYVRKNFYDVEFVAHYGNRFPLNLSDRPRTRGIAAEITKTKWLVEEEISKKSAFFNSSFITREKIKAFVGVCLEVGTDIVGVLYVSYRKPHRFDEVEETLVRTLANQAAIAIYNSRRFERTNEDLARSYNELQSLQRIDNIISSTLDLTEVLHRILDEGMKIVNAPTGTIQLLDSSTEELVFRAGRGMEKDRMPRRIKLNEGITGRVAAEKKSLLVHDLRNYEGSFVAVMHDQSLSELAVPIILGEGVIGVLNVESPMPNHFSERDQSLFEALAGQSTIAIQNAQRYESTEKAYEQIKKERKRFEALAAINRVIGGTQSVDEVIKALMQEMGDVLAVDNRGILLYDPDKDQLVVHPSAYYRVDPDKKGEIIIKVGMDSDPGLTAWVARHRKSLRIDDVWDDPRYLNLISSTRSELIIPMVLDNRLVGVLNLESEKTGFFTEDDQRLVEAIADEMVIAIEKAERNELIARQQRQSILQKKWSQIGELVSTLTHRIGNDIGLIRVYADKLKAIPNLNSDAQKQVDLIGARANSLISLTHQFFGKGLSRVFAEDQKAKKVEVKTTVLSAIEHCQELKNFNLTVSLDIEPTYLLTNDRLLEEVFSELIINATRATQVGDSIEIRAKRTEIELVIEVADTGRGIPSEHADVVFKPFQKLGEEGHGFGLWWAKGFIQDLGGNLTHQPNQEQGRGTIFTVALPVERST